MTSHKERAHPRMRTLLNGKIVFNNRFSVMECMICDLSEGGARIEFATPFEPPQVFELEAPKKNLRVWGRRVWSGGKQHGVAFFEPGENPEMKPVTDDASANLQRILDAARLEIAGALGVPVAQVKLSLELPPSVTGGGAGAA